MIEKRPVVLLLLATAAILVGTTITMIAPFRWINDQKLRIPGVKPYSVLQLEGRDIYIREGCNNCHTQTVRPLLADVERYGEYSKAGEFVYDQPFLWGSRRTGPDLARIGGKYPDAWHYKHMANPSSMVPETNMPSYAFLNRPLDTTLSERKMKALSYPYTQGDLDNLEGKSEMDAIVAYLQKLGNDIPWRAATAAETALENPFKSDPATISDGREIYSRQCAKCHGAKMEGGAGHSLLEEDYPDNKFFKIIHDGIKDAGMPQFGDSLSSDQIWKVTAFIQSRKAK